MDRENFKKILQNLCEYDYAIGRVDLHIHSNLSDGTISAQQIVEKANNRGTNHVAIADHNTIAAYTSTNILSNPSVISAVEFDCIHRSIPIHILAYAFDIDNKEIRSLLAKTPLGSKYNLYRIFQLRNPKEVIDKIHSAGGVSILAHPACYWCVNLEKFIQSLVDMGLDGIEAYYPYRGIRGIFKFHSAKLVQDIANKLNLVKTGGSDSHGERLL